MNDPEALDLPVRPRRLRRTPALRSLTRENEVSPDDLVIPLFVIEGEGEPEVVDSMPGVMRRSITGLVEHCRELSAAGLKAVALFPRSPEERKDADGSEALRPEALAYRAARALKEALPDLVLIGDLALDPYTSHGHDGILDDSGDVDNDATVSVLARMSALCAEAGFDVVAPSDMMDGRVGAIRRALDEAGFPQTSIMAYSAKFASAYYGPFRDAVGSSRAPDAPPIDKGTYQLNPANYREALRELRLDEEEGADFLMVKPAEPYLDVIRAARELTDLPVAAYQVSGEYARLWAAAERGWLDLDACMRESLLSIKRAGADLILTYFAERILRSANASGAG